MKNLLKKALVPRELKFKSSLKDHQSNRKGHIYFKKLNVLS